MPKNDLKLPPKSDAVWRLFDSPASARRERKPLPSRQRRRPPTTSTSASTPAPAPPPVDLLRPYAALLTPPAPMIGMRSMRLEVVRYDPQTQRYECLCDCGGTAHATPDNVSSGRARSCGCWVRESRAFDKLMTQPDASHTLMRREWLAAPGDRLLERARGIHKRWWDEWGFDADPELALFPAWYKALGPKPRPADEVTRKDPWSLFSAINIGWSTDAKAPPRMPSPPTLFKVFA